MMNTSRSLVAVALGCGVLLLGACGSSFTVAASSNATTTTTANGSFAAFQQCLSKHGVKLPARRQGRGSGQGGPPGGSTPTGSAPTGSAPTGGTGGGAPGGGFGGGG